ncbi:MAG TPA: ATP-binding cassette domain-containing protein [Anaerolineales bacterium]|nr:ATP-binding cassette domain-containing protein [Anaerolineales bacterium]HRF47956.1 ATP-binding cassette domain-containing protein [Anaerolineales bacterium]
MTPALSVKNLSKAFANVHAVQEVSFEVARGAIFGLLGPNGAGKTTTIRMIMDILKPDSGQIQILDHAPGLGRENIGYLPEERGLYRGLRVLDTLVYFGELKGLTTSRARERALELLVRVELDDRAKSKVQELSRGMQQKLQLAATIIHQPDLVILDEPFQGLDPVNVDLIRRLIRELRDEGKTIILSAHEMHLVETLCERIALINRGRIVLNGDLTEIKRQFSPNALEVAPLIGVGGRPGVAKAEPVLNGDGRPRGERITLEAGVTPQIFLKQLIDGGAPLERFEIASVPLDEIFVRVVTGKA